MKIGNYRRMKTNRGMVKKEIDIMFIVNVAREYGHEITESEACKAHKIVISRTAKEDYYYGLKEYFNN